MKVLWLASIPVIHDKDFYSVLWGITLVNVVVNSGVNLTIIQNRRKKF